MQTAARVAPTQGPGSLVSKAIAWVTSQMQAGFKALLPDISELDSVVGHAINVVCQETRIGSASRS